MKLVILISCLVLATSVYGKRIRGQRNYDYSKDAPEDQRPSTWRQIRPAKVRSIGGVQMGRVTVDTVDVESLNRFEDFADWRDFKRTHNKVYETPEEEQTRFKIYIANKKKIEEHNRKFIRGEHSFNVSMNQFGDLTLEEFVSTMNGFQRNYGESLASPNAVTFLPPHNVIVPDLVDWRTKGYVTPVKNQGNCGSCWSFSATGALEGQHMRKTGKLVSLSEQNLVDCSTPEGNQGCNGGLMDQAFQYIKDNDGIDTELSYPYEAKDDRCRFQKTKVGADDTGFVDITPGSEKDLQNAVATVGPISVAIDAGHTSFQFYSGGVYYEPECSSSQLDHGVLAVGYGTSQDGQAYWLVKNSWGPKWGSQGYIMMARNRENHCGIATAASYPLV